MKLSVWATHPIDIELTDFRGGCAFSHAPLGYFLSSGFLCIRYQHFVSVKEGVLHTRQIASNAAAKYAVGARRGSRGIAVMDGDIFVELVTIVASELELKSK